jgi:hypothetical protein
VTRGLAIAGLLLVLAGVVLGASASSSRSGRRLSVAVATLGPLSGWRCAQTTPYTYDPRREQADRTLLAEPPERLVPSDVEVERVEANLRGGDTVLWTHVVGADGSSGEQRVYVLSPGQLRAVDLEIGPGEREVCHSQLGNWEIVGEHGLG